MLRKYPSSTPKCATATYSAPRTALTASAKAQLKYGSIKPIMPTLTAAAPFRSAPRRRLAHVDGRVLLRAGQRAFDHRHAAPGAEAVSVGHSALAAAARELRNLEGQRVRPRPFD